MTTTKFGAPTSITITISGVASPTFVIPTEASAIRVLEPRVIAYPRPAPRAPPPRRPRADRKSRVGASVPWGATVKATVAILQGAFYVRLRVA